MAGGPQWAIQEVEPWHGGSQRRWMPRCLDVLVTADASVEVYPPETS